MSAGRWWSGSRAALGVALVAVSLAIVACEADPPRARPTPQPKLAWTLLPPAPLVGPATLTVTLHAADGAPLTKAAVHLEAHMSHPGMAPVVADATEKTPGVYDLPFTFTMPGDWVLLLSATLPDGARLERRIDVAKVRSAE